jgi:hypothetical protein
MYKINLDITKKSIKQIAVISAFATLLLAAMSSVPVMNSFALSLSGVIPSLGSSDNNNNSISTNDFLSCFGVGTECTNVNVDDNSTTP